MMSSLEKWGCHKTDRLKIGSILFFCLAIWVLTGGVSAAEIYNRVVAVVNDDVITLHELNMKMKEMTGLEPAELKSRDENKYLEVRRGVLDLIIDEKITLEKITELGIQVTEGEVDAAIEKIKKENRLTHEDLLGGLKKRGIEYEAYRGIVKKDLERMRLINYEVKSKIIIRDEKIQEYYDRHQDEFRTEGGVRLATIFLKRLSPADEEDLESLLAKAHEILSRIKDGESFEELARKNSEGPGAAEGGDLGFFKGPELDPDLNARVNALAEGEVSEPIVRPAGVQIIKILEKRRGSQKPFEEVKSAIYSVLYREEVNKRYTSWIKELRERAYTKIFF